MLINSIHVYDLFCVTPDFYKLMYECGNGSYCWDTEKKIKENASINGKFVAETPFLSIKFLFILKIKINN